MLKELIKKKIEVYQTEEYVGWEEDIIKSI